MKVKFCRRELSFGAVFRRLFSAWLLAVTVEYIRLPASAQSLAELRCVAELSPGGVLLGTLAIALLLQLLSLYFPTEKAERLLPVFTFLPLAFTALRSSFSLPFLGICLLVLGLLAVFALRGGVQEPEPAADPGKAHRGYTLFLSGLSLLFFLFVCAWTLGRLYSFKTPTYDFGIFSQMFYNMKERGLPVTTVERELPISHFAVHVSPIYYLLLPIYCLFPYPATLQILQAGIMASSVLPLWYLGKELGLSPLKRTLVCGLLLLNPGFSGGAAYDLHENCFLTPLLLWLLYGIHRRKGWLIFLFAFLTLCVKEDAAVYVGLCALWLLTKTLLRGKKGNQKDLRTAVLLLVMALLWFFLATTYLARYGDGVMTDRYKNFDYEGKGALLTVVKAVLLCPMKMLYECVGQDKPGYIALTLLPMLGLPLWTRHYERYLLLIPYVLVNLMPGYSYQHNLFFQYQFGSLALLLYLCAANLGDLHRTALHKLLPGAAVLASGICFACVCVPKGLSYPVDAVKNASQYRELRSALATVEEDASVTAATFYTVTLSQRELLYDLRYCTRAQLLESQYVVFDRNRKGDFQSYASPGGEDGDENLISLLEEEGYICCREAGESLVIYRRTEREP